MPVNMGHLSVSKIELNAVHDLFYRYRDVFSKDDNDAGFTTTVKHSIRLQDDKPIVQPYRRLPPTQYEEVKNYMKKLLENKIIRESISPYASPIVFGGKKR